MKKVYIFVALIGLSLVAVFLYLFYGESQRLVLAPKRGDVVETIYGLGTVVSDSIYHVRVGTSLTVQNVMVKEDDHVKKGDALIQLDEVVQKSPIEGVITSIQHKKGELVSAQSNVVTVTNLQNLFLEVSLEQQSVLRVKAGQIVKVSFESIRSEKLEGKVVSVYPREKQFIIRVDLAKWPEGVLPGMTADLAIVVGQKQNVILIPLAALSAGKLTRVRSGKKEKVDVSIGALDDNWAEVTSNNIELSDLVIVKRK